MAVDVLAQLVHISVHSWSKKSSCPIFSSLPLASLTPHRSPLPSFSIETSEIFAVGFSLPFNRRIRHLIAATSRSTPNEGEVEAKEIVEDNEIPAKDTESTDIVALEKPPRKPRVKLGNIIGILNKRAIEESLKLRPLPALRAGDIVEIKATTQENKKRPSIFKGIIMAKQNSGIHTTIRIRNFISGVGVEIVFPIYSPIIKEIKVVSHRKVRRARLNYLRDKLPRFSTFE